MGVRTGLLAIALLSPVLVAARSGTVHANNSPSPSQHVAVSLIAETRNIVPGQPFHLALRQQIEPGWHTYWINPGDSGLPTEILWTLPPGFRAGPILWPQPKRIAYGPVVDYGYENEIVLPIDIDVPATLTPAANVVIEAHASWLVCSDTCIPEDAHLNISVPVGVDTEPDPRWVERFAHARSQLPLPNPFPTTASINGENITLQIAMGDAQKLRELMFFPEDRSVIDDDAPQISAMGSAGLTLTLQRSNKAKPPPAMLRGVLAFRDSAAQSDVGTEAIAISTPIQPHTAAVSVERSFVWALVLAFAGGVLLNLMPCVLPVLSIKAFGLVQHAQSGPGAVRAQGIAYTVGVVASFAAIAAMLLGVRAAGTEIGWGFQLQSPLFVALMIYVMFAVGLNLSGVFSVGERIAGVAGEISSESYSGSFLTGALATLVATPCTAPFMAAALGYAITQPWYRSLAIFEAVGLGMAFPYLAIAFSPGLRRFLPRPGAWMLTLKQFLAFPIYGTAVWLTFVLA